MIRYGIDLGGTKIEIAALDAQGQIRLRRRVATPRDDYDAILRAIAALLHDARGELQVSYPVEFDDTEPFSVGVGAPGAVSSSSGRLKNSNTACLNGKPLKQDLEGLLGYQIRLANDANCFALSEAVDGAAAGASVVFGVILGTGVGSGIVVDGKIIEGTNSIAGEWGHNPLSVPETDSPARICYCGRSGCVETWLSGPGFAADHAMRHGGALSAKEIIAAALQGETAAMQSLGRYTERLARALSNVINILDPEVIVLGGGLSNIDWLYRDLPELLLRHVFSDRVDTRVVRNHHGDSSGVRGAAWLWGGNLGSN
ncbi:MAG: ROK family protein [Burkholderiales bacterium]